MHTEKKTCTNLYLHKIILLVEMKGRQIWVKSDHMFINGSTQSKQFELQWQSLKRTMIFFLSFILPILYLFHSTTINHKLETFSSLEKKSILICLTFKRGWKVINTTEFFLYFNIISFTLRNRFNLILIILQTDILFRLWSAVAKWLLSVTFTI